MTWVDHAIVVAITVVLPVHDLLFWYPRLLRAGPDRAARARLNAYRESVIVLWALGAVTAWWWWSRGRDWLELGVSVPEGWGFWSALALSVVVMGLLSWQRISLERKDDPEVETAVLEQIEPLRALLPHTPREMATFGMVSFTAGVCEELLFRGFLLWYLLQLIPSVPAYLVGALLFGMAHAYQGVRGIVQTAAVGLGLVVLYLLSGSLWIPMVVHAFVDWNSGRLAYAFLRRRVI